MFRSCCDSARLSLQNGTLPSISSRSHSAELEPKQKSDRELWQQQHYRWSMVIFIFTKIVIFISQSHTKQWFRIFKFTQFIHVKWQSVKLLLSSSSHLSTDLAQRQSTKAPNFTTEKLNYSSKGRNSQGLKVHPNNYHTS